MARDESGKVFQVDVARALRVAGWVVEEEQLLGHKKVDLVARQIRWGETWTVVVECKDYRRQLQRTEVTQIWADYSPLITSRLADEVLIVSANGLAPSAVNYVKSIPGLRTQTLAGVINTAIDFSTYLSTLIANYEESSDGLKYYYTPPRTADHKDLEATIRSWIVGTLDSADAPDPNQPIAILGAYGIGKSSFATYFSAMLAREATQNPAARVPVLIRLGEVAGEQTLAGLLGKHFTATYQVNGYSFGAFREMNRGGRFVILLDGFDEMKQLLSWREFQANLAFLNELQEGDARLIILGRPTAFETDEEHRLALHGERVGRSGSVRRESGWPDYNEIELAPLESVQMRSFLQNFLAYHNAAVARSQDDMDRIWHQLNSHELIDMARRPVQLRMLAQILPSYAGDIRNLGLANIYEIFIEDLIDGVMQREEQKASRRAFKKEERLQFLKDFAFWLWESQHSSIVTTEMIPDEIVERFVHGRDWDLVDVRRDLVAGSPLDRRTGERIRFPHRSFQEFLVARVIWDRLADKTLNAETVVPLVTTEVATFIRAQRQHEQQKVACDLLLHLQGELPLRVVRALFLDEDIINVISEKIDAWGSGSQKARKTLSRPTPWELLVPVIGHMQGGKHGTGHALSAGQLSALAHADPGDGGLALICLFGLLGSGERSAKTETAIAGALDSLLARTGSDDRISSDRVQRKRVMQQGSLSSRRWADPDVIRLDDDFVGLRQSRVDRDEFIIGRRMGGGRITGSSDHLQITGSRHLEIRWLPEFIVELARKIIVSDKKLDLRGIRPIFAACLPEIAFLTDWLAEDASEDKARMLGSDVRLLDYIAMQSVSSELLGKLEKIKAASEIAAEETERTRIQKEARRREISRTLGHREGPVPQTEEHA